MGVPHHLCCAGHTLAGIGARAGLLSNKRLHRLRRVTTTTPLHSSASPAGPSRPAAGWRARGRCSARPAPPASWCPSPTAPSWCWWPPWMPRCGSWQAAARVGKHVWLAGTRSALLAPGIQARYRRYDPSTLPPSCALRRSAPHPLQVRLCDAATCRCLGQYRVGGERASAAAAGAITAIAWFPGSRRFLAATHKAVEVFDARPSGSGSSGPLHRIRSPHAFLYDVAVAGSDCLVTVGQDRKIGFTRCACWAALRAAVRLPAWLRGLAAAWPWSRSDSVATVSAAATRGPPAACHPGNLHPAPPAPPTQAERRARAAAERFRHGQQHCCQPLRPPAGHKSD